MKKRLIFTAFILLTATVTAQKELKMDFLMSCLNKSLTDGGVELAQSLNEFDKAFFETNGYGINGTLNHRMFFEDVKKGKITTIIFSKSQLDAVFQRIAQPDAAKLKACAGDGDTVVDLELKYRAFQEEHAAASREEKLLQFATFVLKNVTDADCKNPLFKLLIYNGIHDINESRY